MARLRGMDEGMVDQVLLARNGRSSRAISDTEFTLTSTTLRAIQLYIEIKLHALSEINRRLRIRWFEKKPRSNIVAKLYAQTCGF